MNIISLIFLPETGFFSRFQSENELEGKSSQSCSGSDELSLVVVVESLLVIAK